MGLSRQAAACPVEEFDRKGSRAGDLECKIVLRRRAEFGRHGVEEHFAAFESDTPLGGGGHHTTGRLDTLPIPSPWGWHETEFVNFAEGGVSEQICSPSGGSVTEAGQDCGFNPALKENASLRTAGDPRRGLSGRCAHNDSPSFSW